MTIANLIHVTFELQGNSGLAEDRYVTTFNFRDDTVGGGYADAVNEVQRFYEEAGSGTKLSAYLAGRAFQKAQTTIKAYIGPPPWTTGPVETLVYTLGTESTANCMPLETAFVLTTKAAAVPTARERGRVYIGPLNTNAFDQATDSGAKPKAAFTADVRRAASALKLEADALDIPWCVWSRADNTLRDIIGGWTDDAPDTQRRRGFKPVARTAWA